MKKVVLTVAIALGGLSTFATSAFPIKPIAQIELIIQDEYKEIAAEGLPQAIKDAVAKDFPTATINKAYVSEKQEVEYKLDLMVDGETLTVFSDKNGHWIEKE